MRKTAATCISDFSSNIGITISSTNTPTLYNYLVELYNEANVQFNGNGSILPALKKESNFPNIYNFYGSNGNEDDAFHTMIGWLFACQLAELKMSSRTAIFKYGYEYGGYTCSSNIYGYTFNYDPIVNRIVAGFIYAGMRGIKNPSISTMLTEIGSSKYNKTLYNCWATDSDSEVGTNDFFIDLRQFLPSAPGPYHSDYSRSGLQSTIGDSTHDSTYKIPEVDYQIYSLAVNNYRLNNSTYKAATVQAIADADGKMSHIFGSDNKGTYDGVTINNVFGTSVIGTTLDENSDFVKFIHLCGQVGSASRTILQSTKVSPKQYGRCRPGSSWRQDGVKATSSSNIDGSGRSGGSDYYNVSVNAQIDDWDGHPTGYYDQYGNWIYPNDDDYTSPEDYEEKQKNNLYANSYPSGHSSTITSIGMLLTEKYPSNADKILKAANQFAVNRTIVKYHWNSDTLIGRVLGTAGYSISHAAIDFDSLYNGDYSTVEGGSYNGGSNPSNTEGYDTILYADRPDETLPETAMGGYHSTDGTALEATSYVRESLGDITNIVASYGNPKVLGICPVNSNGTMIESGTVEYVPDGNGGYVIYAGIRQNNTNTPVIIRLYTIFQDVNLLGYITVVQKAGDGSGNNQGNDPGNDPGNNPGTGGEGDPNYNPDYTTISSQISLIGYSRHLKYKIDIINDVITQIQVLKVHGSTLRIDGLAYNNITLYSYFHNDVIEDMKELWALYDKLKFNYNLLVEYKEDVENWTETKYNPFVTQYNNFNTQYNNFSNQYTNFNNEYNSFSTQYENSLNILNNGGPYYIYSGMSEAVYYTWEECAAYNYNLPGARHTTDIKDEGDDTETETETQIEPSTYSLSINVSNVTYRYISGQKSSYENGDVVTIELTASSGYELPSNVSYSGCSVVYSKNSGELIITISGNANVTISGVASGEQEPDPPGSITFADSTKTYTFRNSDLPGTPATQIPTIVYPNNESPSNYTITWSSSDTSIVELISDDHVTKLNAFGTAVITATMKKNGTTITTGSYTIIVNEDTSDVKVNLMLSITNELDTPIWPKDVTIGLTGGNTITIHLQYTSSNVIASAQSKNISTDSTGTKIEISQSNANKITTSSPIYIQATKGSFNSGLTSISCICTNINSNYGSGGTTYFKVDIKTVNLYSTINNIITDDDIKTNNKDTNIDELNEAYLIQKTSKVHIPNDKSKNDELIYGGHWVIYYTWEECAEYNYNLSGALHTTDVKVASEAQYSPATIPSFPSLPGSPPSLPGSLPTLPGDVPVVSSLFDETLVPIGEYTYTWEKGLTYHKPYYDESRNEQIISTFISYDPTIQTHWQTMIYTYMKWSNNQFDDHMPIIY